DGTGRGRYLCREVLMRGKLAGVLYLGVSALLYGGVLALLFMAPGDPAQAGKDVPPEVKKRLEKLYKEIKANKWSFEVGHSKATERTIKQLTGLKPPPAQQLAMQAVEHNKVAKTMLQFDRTARAEFLKTNKDVKLPGLEVKPRVEWELFHVKTHFDWRDQK